MHVFLILVSLENQDGFEKTIQVAADERLLRQDDGADEVVRRPDEF
jgi:hypothetical protein